MAPVVLLKSDGTKTRLQNTPIQPLPRKAELPVEVTLIPQSRYVWYSGDASGLLVCSFCGFVVTLSYFCLDLRLVWEENAEQVRSLPCSYAVRGGRFSACSQFQTQPFSVVCLGNLTLLPG